MLPTSLHEDSLEHFEGDAIARREHRPRPLPRVFGPHEDGGVLKAHAALPPAFETGRGAGRRGRRVVDKKRFVRKAAPRAFEDLIDGGVVRQRHVHSGCAPRGFRRIIEGFGSLRFERARFGGRPVPHLNLLSLFEQPANEIRAQKAHSKEGNHDGPTSRARVASNGVRRAASSAVLAGIRPLSAVACSCPLR
jgi:hypothetical protein